MYLTIPYLKGLKSSLMMEEISVAMDKLEQHEIQKLSWPEFLYRPEVAFSIAHTGDCILLKYFVKEKAIRVAQYKDNSPVHEDSCVEFFIALGDGEEYYNLEFNCAGTCLFGYGKNSTERELISADHIRKIRRLANIRSNVNGSTICICWELAAIIPVDALVYHKVSTLRNKNCRVNFYKCGDKLPEPHFLSWQEMKTTVPDFHSAKFFGDARFE